MKTKKPLKNLIVICFFAVCLVPLALLAAGHGSSAQANEVQAPAPVLVSEEGFNEGYLSGISDWFADRYGLRNRMIELWNRLNVKLFGTSPEGSVIAGGDGWLFYSDTLDDYCGSSLTDDELECVVRNISLAAEYARNEGKLFILAVAPNKNSLYPDHMPERFRALYANETGGKLRELCGKYSIDTADLFECFENEDEVLYYATDSHWTAKGAARGADTILASLGIESGYYDAELFEESGIHTGDLYEMVYPGAAGTETERSYVPGFLFSTKGDSNGGNAISISTYDGAGEGSLYCWRDSFGIAMYPYLADGVEKAFFSRATEYNVANAVKDADYIVLEIVERNLPRFLNDIIYCPSPLREFSPAAPAGTAVYAVVDSGDGKSVPGMVKVSGRVEEASLPARIYLTAGENSYECFTSLADGVTGFTAWISLEDAEREMFLSTVGDEITSFPVELFYAKDWNEFEQESDAETVVSDAESGESLEKLIEAARACVDGPVEELLAAVGEPLSSDYAKSCLGYGYDGELRYDGFVVYTFQDSKSEIVRDVFAEAPESDPEGDRLEPLIREILDELKTDGMSPEEALKTVYNYTVNHFRYLKRGLYAPGEDDWSEKEAYRMLSTGYGNCYNYAAVFCELAKATGWDAHVRSGIIGPDKSPHGWVEITIDGVLYVFDPETEMSWMRKEDARYEDMYMMEADGNKVSRWEYSRPGWENWVEQEAEP